MTTSGIPDPAREQAGRRQRRPVASFGFSWPRAVSLRKPQFLNVGFPWISLDSLVRNEMLSMGYTRFSVENFSRPFRPVEAPDLASVIGEGVIAHRASLRCLLFFCKELSRELCPVGRADLKAPPSRPPSTRAVDHIHSSRSPALRSPSARAGGIAKRSVSIFTVSLGLARSASARTDFASSILPWSA